MAQCNKCGAAIIFAELPSGTKVPLDSTARVYRVIQNQSGARAEVVTDCMVTHFATCKGVAASNGSAPPPKREFPDTNVGRVMEFMHQLDNADVELNDFEAQFVASTIEREVKYNGNVKFTERQLSVIDKMRDTYGARVAGVASTPRVDRPPRPAATSARPNNNPPRAQAAPAYIAKDDSSDIPF